MLDRPEAIQGSGATVSPDGEARTALRRFKRRATLLLGAMAVVAVGAEIAERAAPGSFGLGLLAAAGKAGLVGGLADWFAVTALFRRPLGLPIPHTAILPKQKDRLGRALGTFVATHVFTDADIERALDTLDLPGLLARALRDERVAGAVRGALARGVPAMLAAL
ncbi:MAG: DUF445 family protein, partial [Gluconacetobacter diazotrophicus]|nr:DUF445 family protein [Gluconacetobacter diazotrophicus]